MRRNGSIGLILVVLVLAAMAALPLLVSVPAVRAQNGAGEFDAARAKARFARVLGDQQPHPADSLASDAVRSRLITELRTIGLNPIVRDQMACNEFRKVGAVSCARVRNVIATLGPPTGKALLLSAHYDSTAVGPGAGDAGIGVATLLEVGAHLQRRQLPRPVILLFNEGEELGLIGAGAFLDDPLSRNVDSVLNFEARGVTGPATMFETSQPNGAAVAAYANAVRRPFASSLMTDVYRLMPNDTDVSVFRDRGWLALNFAITGNETRYHSAGDDLAALDMRSLQHMGDQALAVSTELAAGVPQVQGRRIFVDVLGRGLVQMSLVAGLALFGILLIGFIVLMLRRRAYGRALGTVAAAIVGAGIAGWLGTLAMGAARQGTYWRAHPESTFLAIYATALLAIVIAIRTLGYRARTEQLRAAFWTVFLMLGAALALFAPGAIVYFLAPPFLVLVGALVSRWVRGAEVAGALAALVVLYLTWGEMLALLEELFSPGPLWVFAPLGALVMTPALIEAGAYLKGANRRALILGSGLLALFAWAGAALAPAYSANRQQRFTIEHTTQFPSRKSSWSVLNDGAPLPEAYVRMADWKFGKLPFSERKRWLAPAPSVLGVTPPSVDIVETVTRGKERRVRLRLHTNGADWIVLIAPEEARVRSAGIGRSARPVGKGDAPGKFTISCTGRSCEGAELTMELGAKPASFTLVSSRKGLPIAAKPLVDGRPALARPQYTPDQTMAVTSVKI